MTVRRSITSALVAAGALVGAAQSQALALTFTDLGITPLPLSLPAVTETNGYANATYSIAPDPSADAKVTNAVGQSRASVQYIEYWVYLTTNSGLAPTGPVDVGITYDAAVTAQGNHMSAYAFLYSYGLAGQTLLSELYCIDTGPNSCGSSSTSFNGTQTITISKTTAYTAKNAANVAVALYFNLQLSVQANSYFVGGGGSAHAYIDPFIGFENLNDANNYQLLFSPGVENVATPLPAAFPLFATGLGALGLLGWRRKRKNAAALAAA